MGRVGSVTPHKYIAAVLLCLWTVNSMRDPAVWRETQLERQLEERVLAHDRHVDLGVVIKVVVMDDQGTHMVPGSTLKHRVLHEHKFGGLFDTRLRRYVGPSTERQVWFASEDQWSILEHDDVEVPGDLAFGSEGSGKSSVFPMWHYLNLLRFLGNPVPGEGLQTAPTNKRLTIVRDEIFRLWPREWYTYSSKEQILTFCDGRRIRFASTHKQSEDGGSPIQGFNALWAGRDEGQDQIAEHEAIENRGRSAPDGYYRQLITCTAKDHPDFRDFKAMLLNSGLWRKVVMLGRNSPFVAPRFWDDKMKVMDPREYLRRIADPDADLLPELAVYHQWSRERNLIVRPQVASDLTYAVLRNYESYTRPGGRFLVLGCHDPGVIYNSTTFCRLIMMPKMRNNRAVEWIPTWMAFAEKQTKQTTATQHARECKKFLQTEYGLELPDQGKVAFFCDPHGKGENDTNYETVYGAFQDEHLDVFNPAAIGGVINKKARVDMLNRLMCAADGTVRFVVAQDDRGKSSCPILVDAFESLRKKEGDTNPEGTRRKNEKDKTHMPAGLAYGLWSFETEFLSPQTIEVAMAEHRRVGV